MRNSRLRSTGPCEESAWVVPVKDLRSGRAVRPGQRRGSRIERQQRLLGTQKVRETLRRISRCSSLSDYVEEKPFVYQKLRVWEEETVLEGKS